MWRYDQRLLNTVYWALGGILGVAALVIGFGWFANFRIYERDKMALAKELKAELDVELGRTRSSLESEASKRSAALEKAMASAAAAAAAKTVDELKGRLRAISYQVDRLQCDKLKAEAAQNLKSGFSNNALLNYIDLLPLTTSAGTSWELAECLEGIQKVLDKQLEGTGSRPDPEIEKDLLAALKKLPDDYSVTLAGIRSRLAKLRGVEGT